MFDQIAYEHGADLRRAAAAYRLAASVPARSTSRAHRATPRATKRAATRVVAFVTHRSTAPIGCQA